MSYFKNFLKAEGLDKYFQMDAVKKVFLNI